MKSQVNFNLFSNFDKGNHKSFKWKLGLEPILFSFGEGKLL